MKKRVGESKAFVGKKEEEEKSEDTGPKPSTNPALEIFDSQLHADLFSARCHDTGETISGSADNRQWRTRRPSRRRSCART